MQRQDSHRVRGGGRTCTEATNKSKPYLPRLTSYHATLENYTYQSLPGTLFLHHIYIETQRRKTAHGNATPQSSHKPPTTPPQETTRPFYLSHLYFFMNLRVSSMVSFRPLASSSCFSAIILARAACAFTACMYRTRQAASVSICVC